MSKVKVSCFALSLEGFGAGPDQTLENPMGRDGLRIQQWAFATRTTFSDLSVRLRTDTGVRWWTLNGKPTFDRHSHFTGYRGVGTAVVAADGPDGVAVGANQGVVGGDAADENQDIAESAGRSSMNLRSRLALPTSQRTRPPQARHPLQHRARCRRL